MTGIFLDTNILVDLFVRRKPEEDASVELLRACQQRELQGYTSSWCLMTLMYLMDQARDAQGKRMCTKAEIVNETTGLLTFLTVVDADNIAIAAGLTLGWSDWEDAILYTLANKHPRIEAIITNDKAFIKRTKKLPGIRAMGPADLRKQQ